jgi:DNA-binding Xre family transcriptional regulator
MFTAAVLFTEWFRLSTFVAYRTIKRIYDDPYYSITITTLGRIAQALEVDPSELVEDDGK